MNSNGKLPTLITGASGGIGADLARVFARHGHPVALVARNGERLQALATELLETTGMDATVAVCDLEQPHAAPALMAELQAAHFSPAILVNNAGFGLNGPFAELELEQQLALIDLNIRALTQLTSLCMPQIVAARGRILNVASVASFFPGPGMAAYYASKAYVLSLGEALSWELAASGVTVSTLCPGPTNTGFMDRAGIPASGKAFYSMPSMPVAEAGYRGLMAGKRIIVPGMLNKLLAGLSGIVPHRISMHGIARMQYRRRRKRTEGNAKT